MTGRKLEKPKSDQKIAPVQQEENKEQEVKVEQVLEEQPTEQEEGPEMQTEEQPEQEEKPKKLYAIYPILFESHQYKVGEQLPTTDMEMVEAWIEAEAAIWK